jgi:hypothetical protein
MKRNIKMKSIIDTRDKDSYSDTSGEEDNDSLCISSNHLSTTTATYYETEYGCGGTVNQCETCRATFKTKTLYEKHRLYCATLAGMRNTGATSSTGSTAGSVANGNYDDPSRKHHKKYTIMTVEDDAILPTPKEMFMLIQELTLKYNKVKDELDVMKTWAKMVGRRLGGISGGGGGGVGGGLEGSVGGGVGGSGSGCSSIEFMSPFTSISRQKRQNMENILNEEDAAMSAAAASTGQTCPLQQRPNFLQWYSAFALNQEHLDLVFQADLVSGIVSILLKMVSAYTTESGKSHLIPFKFADVKQGAFYIYDSPFSHDAPDLPTQATNVRWRLIEPCEFQLMVNCVHKLLLKEFKKWQDLNWEQQNKMNQQRQKATLSYQGMMSSFKCSPAMASCDGMYPPPSWAGAHSGYSGEGDGDDGDDEPKTPPIHLKDAVLTDDFASLYNKYADKIMGGTLTPETIITRVRAKLWKDMKAWML